MADKDFVVKNGLVVSTNTTVDGFIANSTQFTLGTINATANGILANSTAIVFGNTSVSLSMNTTGVSNAFRLGGVLASSYVNTTGNFTVAGNLNITGTNTYFAGKTTLAANLVINTGVRLFDSTGVEGTAGQVLASNGTGNVYWRTISIPGGGLTAIDGVGNVAYDSSRLNNQLPSYYTNASNITTGTLPNTQIGSAYVNTSGNFTIAGNLNITGTNTYFSGKTTIAANLVVNGAIFASGSNGAVGQVLTSNGVNNVYWSTVTSGGPGPEYVTNVDSRVLSGNLNFTGTNVYFTAATFSPAGIYFGANATANLYISSSTVSVGNATVNSTTNSTIMQVANSTTIANLTSSALTVGTSVANTTVLASGANVIANTTALNINAATTNTTITASSISMGNTIANLSISTTALNHLTNAISLQYQLVSNSTSSSGIGPNIRLFRNTQTAGIATFSGGIYFNTSNNTLNYDSSILHIGQGVYTPELRYYTAGAHRFFTNNAVSPFNVLTLTNTYFVGINNTAPTDALSVNGSIRSVGLKAYELATPGASTLTAGTGGSLAAAVYYIRIVAVDSINGVTEPGAEVTRTVSASGTLRVQFDAVPGAAKYRIYFKAGSTPTDTYFETTTNDYTITTTTGASSRTIPAFNSTGAVNIGSFANTDYKLTVENNANGAGHLLLYNSNTGSGTSVGIDLIHNASLSTSQIYHYPDGRLALKAGSSFSFQTGSYTGTERMTLDGGNLSVTGSVTVGTLGINQTGPAIIGYCQTQNSVFGRSYGGIGVVGQSNTNYGVYGISNTNYGIYGISESAQGVLGQSNNLHGVWGQTANTSMFGVVGIAYGNTSVTSGVGVGAYSNSNLGLYAKSNTFTIARFANATATNLSINNLGYIGINLGDTNATTPLHVSQSDPAGSTILITNGANGLRIGANTSVGAWVEGVDGTNGTTSYKNLRISANNISIRTGKDTTNIERLGITPSGTTSLTGNSSATAYDSTLEIRGSGTTNFTGEAGSQIKLINTYSGLTTTTKYVRTSNNGSFQVINQAYDSILFSLNESGKAVFGSKGTFDSVSNYWASQGTIRAQEGDPYSMFAAWSANSTNALCGRLLPSATATTAVLAVAETGVTSSDLFAGYSECTNGIGSPTFRFRVGQDGRVEAAGNITAYYSDRRLKENITPIKNALDKVCSISGVTYNSNKLAESFGYTEKEQQVGVIAQEIEAVLPEAVKLAPFDKEKKADGSFGSKSGENYKTVQYEKIVPLLIEAIKELKAEIELLKGGK